MNKFNASDLGGFVTYDPQYRGSVPKTGVLLALGETTALVAFRLTDRESLVREIHQANLAVMYTAEEIRSGLAASRDSIRRLNERIAQRDERRKSKPRRMSAEERAERQAAYDDEFGDPVSFPAR